MKNQSRMTILILALMSLLFLTACPERTSIAKLQNNPGRYQGKDVTVAGRVTDSYGVLGRGIYQVDDGTGKLWIITESGVPSRGARVGAKGKLLEGFTFAGRNLSLALLENDRRVR